MLKKFLDYRNIRLIYLYTFGFFLVFITIFRTAVAIVELKKLLTNTNGTF